MTDEAKALVFVLRRGVWDRELCKYVPTPELTQAADLIETQAREIERLRKAIHDFLENKSWFGLAEPPYDVLRAALGEEQRDD